MLEPVRQRSIEIYASFLPGHSTGEEPPLLAQTQEELMSLYVISTSPSAVKRAFWAVSTYTAFPIVAIETKQTPQNLAYISCCKVSVEGGGNMYDIGRARVGQSCFDSLRLIGSFDLLQVEERLNHSAAAPKAVISS